MCTLLRRILAVVTNLPETTLEISQQLRRINSIKLNHAFFHCKCLRVLFSAKRLKNDAFCWMVTFASFLLKYLSCFVKQTDYSSIYRALSKHSCWLLFFMKDWVLWKLVRFQEIQEIYLAEALIWPLFL